MLQRKHPAAVLRDEQVRLITDRSPVSELSRQADCQYALASGLGKTEGRQSIVSPGDLLSRGTRMRKCGRYMHAEF